MATPTKFCMGGVPRTGTGLVPASYRRQMDSMCSTKEWTDLPKQPPPIKYPFRGDYVNERNRKMRGVKTTPKKSSQKSPARQKPKDSGIKSTHSPIDDAEAAKRTKQLQAARSNRKWDTYCQHISSTKLSADEQYAKTENKEKMVAYMRSEASKREQRVALEKKLQEELGTQKVEPKTVENETKPRKPRVPRLSHFGRTGKRTKSEMEKLEASKHEKDAAKENKCDRTQPKARSYLDFISKKVEKPKPPTRSTEARDHSVKENGNANARKISTASKQMSKPKQTERIEPKMNTLNEVSIAKLDDSNDEDRFRMQIERIVHKAAAMVLDNNDSDTACNDLLDSSALAQSAGSTTSSWCVESDSSKYNSERTDFPAEHEIQSKCNTHQTSQQSEWFDAQNRLSEFEERIRCLSPGSTLMREVKKALQPIDDSNCIGIELQSSSAFSSSSSQISEVTFHLPPENGHNYKEGAKQMFPVLDGIEEDTNDSSTEIVPRPQIEPMQLPSNWHVNMSKDSQQTNNDSFSWSVSLTNECESAQERALPFPSEQPNASLATKTCTEKQLPSQMNILHFDDEQPMESCIRPLAVPSQHFEWEDEPLPRGYEFHSQQSEYEMAGEIFSLLD